MGTYIFKLTLPSAPFVELSAAKIYFVEEGVLRPLQLSEWRAYFPGCSDPKVLIRGTSSTVETAWMGGMTDRFMPMLEHTWPLHLGEKLAAEALPDLHDAIERMVARAGEYSRRFPIVVRPDDTEPPTVWTLLRFMGELRNKLGEFPAATLSITYQLDETGTVHPQLQAMAGNEIRRAFDRGEIDSEEYRRQMATVYPGSVNQRNTRNSSPYD